MRKNTAGQVVGAQLINKADGTPCTTGTTTVYVTGDGGTQAAGSVGSGACTHEGNGFWTYAPAQAETNYDHAAFTFVNTAAVNATVQIYTSFPQTGDNFARLGAPAGASVSADVAAVKAETASIQADTNDLQTRLPAALVSGRMDSSVGAMAANVMTAAAAAADLTTELQAGLATSSAITTLQTGVDDLPTNAELATALGTADDAVLAQVALVKAKTDGLPSDPADESLIIAATDAIMGRLGAPAGASVSADIAAAKSDTAAILTDTAEIGVAGAGLTAVASAANLATVAGFVDTEVAAILAVTAKLDTALELDGAVYRLTANALEQAPTGGSAPTAAAIADAVWDEAAADHVAVGSTGEALGDAGGAGTPPTVGEIADEVQTRTLAAVTVAGSVSGAVGSVTGNVGGNVAGSVASVTADVGITQAGADKVWGSAARTLTSFGTLVADTVTAVWAATTRLLTAGTNIVLAKGTGVTGFNDLSAAQVNAEADTALADYDAPTKAEMDSAIAGFPAAPAAAAVASAVRTELATELGRVDAAVSTRLATASYTTPDNAGIATAVAGASAIFARTDVATSTRLAAGSYVAPDNAGIAAVQAKTDALPSDPADQSILAGLIASIAAPPSAAAVASAVRTELTTELARVDVATSTRAAPGDAVTLTAGERGDVADKMLGRSLAGGADGGRTVQDALRPLRNKTSILGGTLIVMEEDDVTEAWRAAVTTTAGNPLSAIDPV